MPDAVLVGCSRQCQGPELELHGLQSSQTHLSLFDANICEAKGRASAEMYAGMSLSVDGARHCNLHILELSALGDAPPERREGSSYRPRILASAAIAGVAAGSEELSSYLQGCLSYRARRSSIRQQTTAHPRSLFRGLGLLGVRSVINSYHIPLLMGFEPETRVASPDHEADALIMGGFVASPIRMVSVFIRIVWLTLYVPGGM